MTEVDKAVSSSTSATSDEDRLSPRVRGLLSPRVREQLEWMGYTLGDIIGGGAFGVVVRAVERKMNRPVAIKLVSLPLLQRGDLSASSDELRALAQLRHPHVVPLITAGTIDGRVLYLVMPFIPGSTLRQLLHRQGRLPVPAVLRLGIDLADALVALHALDLVHRDIKPDNVLVDGQHAMIIDFGLVCAARRSETASADEASLPVIGTPAYMSPEQWHGDAALDTRADVYSLGCLLYELLCGVPPYTPTGAEHHQNPHRWTESLRTQDDLTRWESTAHQAVPALREKRSDIPRALAKLIERAIQPDRDRRPTSTEWIRNELLAVQAQVLTGQGDETDRRRRTAALVGTGALAAALFMLRPPAPETIVVASAPRAGTLAPDAPRPGAARALIAPVVNGVGDPALDPIVATLTTELERALLQTNARAARGEDKALVFVPTVVSIDPATLRRNAVAALKPLSQAQGAAALVTVVLDGPPQRPVVRVQVIEELSGRPTLTLPPVPWLLPVSVTDRQELSRQAAGIAAAIATAITHALGDSPSQSPPSRSPP